MTQLAPPQAAPSRRQALGALSGLLLPGLGMAQASPHPPLAPRLPLPTSLAEELRSALAAGQPLVVMVSLDGCGFCKIAREHYLAPLREREGLPVVQLDMRSPRAVKDFAGASTTHEQVIRSWNTRIAPTVFFFGAHGAEIAPRLRGMGLPEFYGAYLDERLLQARRVLRG